MNLRMPESKSGALTTWRHPSVIVGRATRIELTTSRATIWRSNQLSYTRHILVRLKRFELLTHGLEGRCSIQLSYRRNWIRPAKLSGAGDGNRTHAASLEGWNSTIELHPHLSHFAAVSTTLVYNSTSKKNCQTKNAHFFKNLEIFFICVFFNINSQKNVKFLRNKKKNEKFRENVSLFKKIVL